MILNIIFSYYNHQIVSTGLLYLYRCIIVLLYHIGVLVPELTCMEATYSWVLVEKLGRLSGSIYFGEYVPDDVVRGNLKDTPCLHQYQVHVER